MLKLVASFKKRRCFMTKNKTKAGRTIVLPAFWGIKKY
jgi:hypothetical protein